MTNRALVPGTASVKSGAKMVARIHSITDVGFAQLVQQNVLVEVDPYVVVNGFPEADSDYGTALSIVTGVSGDSVSTVRPNAADVDIQATHRWLPYPQWVTAPAAGTRRWYPIETNPGDMVASGTGVSGVPVPMISLYQSSSDFTAHPTGRDVYGPNAPALAPAYSYRGYDGEIHLPAMIWDGKGNASIDSGGLFNSFTFGYVVVMHPSSLSFSGMFEAKMGTDAHDPLVFRYTHGRFDIAADKVQVLSHETHKGVAEALIILVTLDTENGSGRMLVLDRTRATKEFSIDGFWTISFTGLLGALGQVTNAGPVRYSAEMDLLELAIWEYAMDFEELELRASQLSMIYGVAG